MNTDLIITLAMASFSGPVFIWCLCEACKTCNTVGVRWVMLALSMLALFTLLVVVFKQFGG